jgi:Trk K+ transport system NAD-binding subunit
MSEPGINPNTTAVLVCGLGSLGQYCVSVLKEFGVTVHGIEVLEKRHWEMPELPELLDSLTVGDCRQSSILEQAQIRHCRAILSVTHDERVNIATAFAARSLNPQIRLVIRSAQDNLNQLLAQHLGNLVAFEPSQLSAAAFALAALGDETLGFFHLENQLIRVVQLTIPSDHRWCDLRQLHELNTYTCRLLSHSRAEEQRINYFYEWEPDTRIQAGDILTWVELGRRLVSPSASSVSNASQFWLNFFSRRDWKNWRQFVPRSWQERHRTDQVAIVCGILVIILFLTGIVLYKLQYPNIALQDAFNVSLVLILGGFDNLFGQLKLSFPIPEWLHLFSAGLTVVGTIFIGILYAMLTEQLLSARFQFLQRRPPVPKANHVVLIGLGQVGRQVTTLLQNLKQPLVGISETDLEPGTLPHLPLVVGNIRDALNRVNLTTAKSVMVLTPDEVANLEIGLMAGEINPDSRLVIRTDDPHFSQNVTRLVPHARALGVYGLAAEAFAAAAFGENILNILHVNHQTILVTEYRVNQGDSLNEQLLADVAYGYGVVPILHQRGFSQTNDFLPLDDIRLHAGDRLIVLATLEGLQKIERGILAIQSWWVRVESAFTQEAIFEGATTIARVSGCDIAMARTLMNHLPGTLQFSLYKHQAQRLVRELRKTMISAHLIDRGC